MNGHERERGDPWAGQEEKNVCAIVPGKDGSDGQVR